MSFHYPQRRPPLPDFTRTHIALFDELERQGVYCVDVGKLTRAVTEAQAIIERPAQSTARPYQRCEACE